MHTDVSYHQEQQIIQMYVLVREFCFAVYGKSSMTSTVDRYSTRSQKSYSKSLDAEAL